MNSFYIYYDAQGAIKAVAPAPQEEFGEYDFHVVDEATAVKFITAEYHIDEWFVVETRAGEFNLQQNVLDSRPSDAGSIIQVTAGEQSASAPSIQVTVYLKSNTFEVSIPQKFVGVPLVNVSEKEMKFILHKPKDPSMVLGEVKVNIQQLVERGSVRYQLKGQLTDFSVTTVKVFRNYHLEVKNADWMSSKVRTGYMNKLAVFKNVDEVPEDFQGVVVYHLINNSTLELKVVGEPQLYTPESSKPSVFLTKAGDPMIFVDTIEIDVNELITKGALETKVKKKAGVKFGVSGFPIADQMLFIRKQE